MLPAFLFIYLQYPLNFNITSCLHRITLHKNILYVWALPQLPYHCIQGRSTKLKKQLILIQTVFVSDEKLLLLELNFVLDEGIVFRVLRNQVLVKSFNIETYFVKQEINYSKVVEEIFLSPTKSLQTNINKPILINDLFKNLITKIFFT